MRRLQGWRIWRVLWGVKTKKKEKKETKTIWTYMHLWSVRARDNTGTNCSWGPLVSRLRGWHGTNVEWSGKRLEGGGKERHRAKQMPGTLMRASRAKLLNNAASGRSEWEEGGLERGKRTDGNVGQPFENGKGLYPSPPPLRVHTAIDI